MEILDSILTLVAGFVFYGAMVIVGLLLLMAAMMVGIGMLLVFILHQLQSTVVVSPFTSETGNPEDFYILDNVPVNLNGTTSDAVIWYQAVEGHFAGIRIVTVNGIEVLDQLDALELERISDIAEHAWDVVNGQP